MARKRLLLVGWDSADWKIIRPLVDAGQMPGVARLLDHGVCGDIATLEPQLSPMLWTSIATGKHAYHHGVPGFTEVDAAGQVVAVSGATRKCKALWEILGERELKSHVVSWFATHGEQPDGCLVSHLYNSWKHQRGDDPASWPAPPQGTYWPEDLGQDLNERRVSPWDIDPDEVLRLLVPEAPAVDQEKDQRLWALALRLSEAFSVHSATCWLMENRQDWDFFAVYYRALDEICHQFMHYHPPQMAGVKDEDFERYQHVVKGTYRLHDLLLTRLMNLAGPDTAIVLVSDHGFHSDHLRPQFTPRVPAGITVWHRPHGIFCAMGPGFRKGGTVYGARLLDVAPTILTWFGLPVGADMEGRVLSDAFTAPPAVQNIPSWEHTGRARRVVPPPDAGDRQALLEQFVALGYIDPVSRDSTLAAQETNRENDWNMARACMDGGRCEEALPLLESVWQLHPERNDYAQMLTICQMRLGLLDEAAKTIAACMESIGGINASTAVIMANIALERNDAALAFEHLQAAGAGGIKSVDHLVLMSRTHLHLRRWDDCAAACHRVLELDPNNPAALLGLARTAVHTGRAGEAVGHALNAIAVQYGNPQGHFLLGAALLQLEDWDAATRALATTVQLQPRNGIAFRLLGAALQRLGQIEAARGAFLKARLCRTANIEVEAARLRRLRAESSARVAEYSAIRESRRAAAEALRAAMDAGSLPADTEFVIVSGLPRSGTSLMMQMLRRGGLEPMTDGQRAADEDNPEGYWEWEDIRRLPGNPRLIEQAHGKAIKVIAPLLPALPPKHRYRIIFMTRPVAEIVTSQARMLERRGQSPRATASHLEQTQQEHASQCLRMLHASPRAEILEVPYPDLIADPAAWAARIAAFLGPDRLPAAGSMAAAVRPELHRNRSPGDA